MKQAIYDYLREELYPLPECDTCQYSDVEYTIVPCNKCKFWDRHKLHKGHDADLKRMAREITRIVKQVNKK